MDEVDNYIPHQEGFIDVHRLIEGAKAEGLELERYYQYRRPTMHSMEMFTFGIMFPKDKLDAAIDFLKKYFENQ